MRLRAYYCVTHHEIPNPIHPKKVQLRYCILLAEVIYTCHPSSNTSHRAGRQQSNNTQYRLPTRQTWSTPETERNYQKREFSLFTSSIYTGQRHISTTNWNPTRYVVEVFATTSWPSQSFQNPGMVRDTTMQVTGLYIRGLSAMRVLSITEV